MNAFIIIMAILFLLVFICIGFFLMCIWRAILGKTGTELKLATALTSTGKKMDTLGGNIDRNSRSFEGLEKQMKEVVRTLNKEK